MVTLPISVPTSFIKAMFASFGEKNGHPPAAKHFGGLPVASLHHNFSFFPARFCANRSPLPSCESEGDIRRATIFATAPRASITFRWVQVRVSTGSLKPVIRRGATFFYPDHRRPDFCLNSELVAAICAAFSFADLGMFRTARNWYLVSGVRRCTIRASPQDTSALLAVSLRDNHAKPRSCKISPGSRAIADTRRAPAGSTLIPIRALQACSALPRSAKSDSVETGYERLHRRAGTFFGAPDFAPVRALRSAITATPSRDNSVRERVGNQTARHRDLRAGV